MFARSSEGVTGAFTYDAIGNPLQYRNGLNFTWQNGRQLASVSKTGLSANYAYNADGIRTSKNVNGTTTNFVWANGSLQMQGSNSSDLLKFFYDENGVPYAVQATNGFYYYVYNLQGDVIALLDVYGDRVVEYEYNPWGELLSVTGSKASTLGQTNPFRYRGYYYDTETGLYYLQSRYYDPVTCRWINADSQLNISLGILGLNQFSYCLNNPVNMVDYGGNKPGDLFDTMDEAARDAVLYFCPWSWGNGWEYITAIYAVVKLEKVFVTVSKEYNLFGWKFYTHNLVFMHIPVIQYSYIEPKTDKDPWEVTK